MANYEIALQTAEFNHGVEKVPERKYVDAIAVGNKIVFFVPERDPIKWTPKAVDTLVKAFGGRLVKVEIIVKYEPTGKFYDPEDFKLAKKMAAKRENNSD